MLTLKRVMNMLPFQIFTYNIRGYSVSDIQDDFEYIIKIHKTVTDHPLIRTYVNNIENRNTIEIKRGYYLELLTPEIMELFEYKCL